VNEGAVGNERGVEGGEWMFLERRQTAEVLGHRLGSRCGAEHEVRYDHSVGEITEFGNVGSEDPVDKDQ